MKKFADFVKEKLQLAGFAGDKEVSNLSRTDRYVIYKIGKVLTVSVSIFSYYMKNMILYHDNH